MISFDTFLNVMAPKRPNCVCVKLLQRPKCVNSSLIWHFRLAPSISKNKKKALDFFWLSDDCFVWSSQNWNWISSKWRTASWIPCFRECVIERFVHGGSLLFLFLRFSPWTMPWKWNHFQRMLFVLDSILFHCAAIFIRFAHFHYIFFLSISLPIVTRIDFCFSPYRSAQRTKTIQRSTMFI